MADSHDRSPRPAALAVVVTAGVTDYLSETLRGISEQQKLPAAVLLVDVTPAADPGHGRASRLRQTARDAGLELEAVRVTQAPTAPTFGAAVTAGLEQLAVQGAGGADLARSPWLWFLHDDSAPEPRALAELLRIAESGPSIALVGAKQRDWFEPDELVELGVTVSPGGRRFTGIEDGELDQGQHDGREDVYAVGTAGALVDRELWELLGGTDPALGPFGDGLDLSRRARLAGRRVVVAPGAVVRHARASYLGLRPGQAARLSEGSVPPRDVPVPRDESVPNSGPLPGEKADVRRSFRARRIAFLHLRLVDAPAITLPLLILTVITAAAVRALWRIATKEFGLAGDELRAVTAVLARPGALWSARRRSRATRRIRAARLRPLRATWRQVWRVGHERRARAAAARRARRIPSDLELAERADLARRRRGTGGFVAALLVAAAAVAYGPLLVAGPLTGGALRPVDASLGELWSAVTTGWVATGDGYPGPPDPLLTALAAPAVLAVGSPQTAVAILVLASIPLAGAGAWFAAGAATRSVRVRAWATVVWALAPALVFSTGQGRLGAIVAHLALPWVALGVARALRLHRRDDLAILVAQIHAGPSAATELGVTSNHPLRGAEPPGSVAAAAGAGLALAVAAAGAPVILPAGLAALALLAVLVRRPRRLLLMVAIPPLVLLAPTLLAAARDVGAGGWRVLLADPGVPVASPPVPSYLALLTWPAEPFPWPLLDEQVARNAPLVATAALVVGALAALVRRGRVRAAQAGWLVALVGVAVVYASNRIEVGIGPDLAGTGGSQIVRGWAGPGTSLVLLGLLIAIVCSADGLRSRLRSLSFGVRHLVAAVLTAVLAVGPLLNGVAWAWQVIEARSTPGADAVLALSGRAADPVPALGLELQGPPDGASVLALATVPTTDGATDGEGIDVRLWRDNGDQLDEQSTAVSARSLAGPPGASDIVPPDAAEESLARLAASLAVGTPGDVSTELAVHGVGVVVVRPGEGEARGRLVARLDATAGLERVTENTTGAVWRVAPPDGVGSIGRITVLGPDGAVTAVVPAGLVGGEGVVDGGPAGRVVVLAERASPGWRAWLDGEPLAPTAVDWRQAFELNDRGGRLVVAYDDRSLGVIHAFQLVVLGLFGLLALPVRRRRPEVRG